MSVVSVVGGLTTSFTEKDKEVEDVADDVKVKVASKFVVLTIEHDILDISGDIALQTGKEGKVTVEGGTTVTIQFTGVVFFGVTENVYVVGDPFIKLSIDAEADVKVFGVLAVADIPVESELTI